MTHTTNSVLTLGQVRITALPITIAMVLLLCLGMFAPAKAANNAAFVSQSVPEVMVPGQVYAVSVTMQNTGTTTWSEANSFRLGSQNPQDNSTWGVGRIYLSSTVAPGANVAFNFNVTAPMTPGVYNFQWKMVQDGVQWFGALTQNVQVSVGSVNNAQFVSQTVPTSMVSNQTYAVSVTMKNNGSNSWAVGDYYLRSQNPEDNTKWDPNRVELPNAVAPGESVTFSFNVKPNLNGTTAFQWRMAQGTTSFGASSTNVNVAVSGTNNAAFVSQSVPEVMVPGQIYAVSVTMQNTGTTTWSEANSFRLGSQNPQDNSTWGPGRVYITGTVAPGANYTFNFNVTAPSTAGVYNFQWKMVRDGYQWFGALSTNVQVAVGNVNNAQFVTQTVASTMVSNQSYAVSVTMRNNGSNPWAVGEYYLRSQSPEDNTKWDLNRVELPNNVAPGENVTFNFSVKPTLNGTTAFQWRMAQGATSFGALSTNVNVSVSGTNNAAFVSQSVPGTMVPGQVYVVSVTMQNTGTNTWRSVYDYMLSSDNPLPNGTWGVWTVPLPNDVAPGQNVTFSFSVTAPSTPGVYNFQWKMLRNNVAWFGTSSTNVQVSVNGANDSQFISQSVPGTMTAGQTYLVSVTLENNGTSIWVPGNYFLGSENPQGNTAWGLDRVDLAAEVGPGASVTFNFNVTAPATPGTYDFQWRMVQNATRFGALTMNISVTVQQTQTMALHFIHTDHLNTPRLVADATGTTVWKWDQQEPFGVNVPEENPSGLGAFDLPLRLPGQYFDKETNLHYNYFRDYDPSLGIYKQSDPIGLKGGLNTYAYVSSSPLSYADPTGLLKWFAKFKVGSLGVGKLGGFKAHFELESECDIDGMKGFATVDGYGATAGVGLPGSGVSGKATFVDGNIRVDPDVFRGRMRIDSIGFQVGPVGLGLTTIYLGGAVASAPNVDIDWGLDVGISFGLGGFADVVKSGKVCCQE